MKHRLTTLALSGALLAGLAGVPASVRAEPVVYSLDPAHSFASFEVLHFDTSTLRGRFGPLSGDITLDRDARRGRVQVVVDTAAASTGLGVLDARIR